MALRKSKSPGGKVNIEGNLSGKAIPRGGMVSSDARMMSKRGSGTASYPAPDSGKVKALGGSTPRSGGRGKVTGPTLPPIG